MLESTVEYIYTLDDIYIYLHGKMFMIYYEKSEL